MSNGGSKTAPGDSVAPETGPDDPNKKGNSICFIATACYGDDSHPDVVTLREWRDQQVSASVLARGLNAAYYTVSPWIARRLEARPALASTVRVHFLVPLARIIARRMQR